MPAGRVGEAERREGRKEGGQAGRKEGNEGGRRVGPALGAGLSGSSEQSSARGLKAAPWGAALEGPRAAKLPRRVWGKHCEGSAGGEAPAGEELQHNGSRECLPPGQLRWL